MMPHTIYDVYNPTQIPQLDYCLPKPTNCTRTVVDWSGWILCVECAAGTKNRDF